MLAILFCRLLIDLFYCFDLFSIHDVRIANAINTGITILSLLLFFFFKISYKIMTSNSVQYTDHTYSGGNAEPRCFHGSK